MLLLGWDCSYSVYIQCNLDIIRLTNDRLKPESRNISLMAIGAFYTRLILKSLVKILNYIRKSMVI